MTDVTYSVGWVEGGSVSVPEASARAMSREDKEAAREAEAAEARRMDRLEQASFMAEREGTDVSLQGVWDRAHRGMAKTDYAAARADLQARVDAGEVEILDGTMKRSRDTLSVLDQQLRRAKALHDDYLSYAVRHAGPATVEAARAESDRRHARRGDAYRHSEHGGEIYR